MVSVLPILVAFLTAFAVLWLLLTPFGRRLVLDHPNERSLHERPVPRTGGLAILGGIAAGAAGSASLPVLVLGLAAALAAVSFLDDVWGLPTLVRLAAHLGAAAALLALEVESGGFVLVVVLALAITWYANLYNFMDGSDGLAGGMAVIGFGAYALAAQGAGDSALAALSATIAAASGAFLAFNFPPARIFMGDVGSVPLGFLAGALGVLGWQGGAWPLWFPVLVFAPFVCDATLTLVKRLARRERVWQAHREHYYQRLVRMGHGHRGTVWIEYAAMAGCAAAALYARTESAAVQAAMLAVATAVLVGIALWVDVRWARHLRSDGA